MFSYNCEETGEVSVRRNIRAGLEQSLRVNLQYIELNTSNTHSNIFLEYVWLRGVDNSTLMTAGDQSGIR